MNDFLKKMFINEAKPALNRHSGGVGGSSDNIIVHFGSQIPIESSSVNIAAEMATLFTKTGQAAMASGKLKEGANYYTGHINICMTSSVGYVFSATANMQIILVMQNAKPTSVMINVGIASGSGYSDGFGGLLTFAIGVGNYNDMNIPTIADLQIISNNEDKTSDFLPLLNNLIFDFVVYDKAEFFIDGTDAN